MRITKQPSLTRLGMLAVTALLLIAALIMSVTHPSIRLPLLVIIVLVAGITASDFGLRFGRQPVMATSVPTPAMPAPDTDVTHADCDDIIGAVVYGQKRLVSRLLELSKQHPDLTAADLLAVALEFTDRLADQLDKPAGTPIPREEVTFISAAAAVIMAK